MKKINVVLVLFLALSLTLAACGGSAPAATAAPVKPAATESPAKATATEAPVVATDAPVAEKSGLSDSFDNNDNEWGLSEDDSGSVQIQDGQMVLKVEKADSWQWVFPQATILDVDLSFDVVLKEGTPSNAVFGVVFRHTDENNYYDFVISDGYYQLTRMVNGKSEAYDDWAKSDAIKTGIGETNRIRAVCSGSSFEFYANDQLLLKAQDTSLSEGDFGLEAGRYAVDDKPVSVTFDNLEAKVLPASEMSAGIPLPDSSQTPDGILLSDSFDNNDNDWTIGDGETGNIQIQDGQLVMKVKDVYTRQWTFPQEAIANVDLADVDLSFDVVIKEGLPSDAAFGVVCRLTMDDENNAEYYELLINDGSYSLNMLVNGELEFLVEEAKSTAIKTGIGETNRIRAICSGDSLELYANDQLLFKKQDATFSEGIFGLELWDYGDPVSVAFDNLEVKVP